jgi:hypothetical protein
VGRSSGTCGDSSSTCGYSSSTCGDSSGAHGRSAWVATRERAPSCHHGSSNRSDPTTDADSRPRHRGIEEGNNGGDSLRTEKIERGRYLANGPDLKRRSTVPASRQNIPFKKLEEHKNGDDESSTYIPSDSDVELRQKIIFWRRRTVRRGMVGRKALPSSHLASKQREPVPDSSSDSSSNSSWDTDVDSLQALPGLEAKLLRKEAQASDSSLDTDGDSLQALEALEAKLLRLYSSL